MTNSDFTQERFWIQKNIFSHPMPVVFWQTDQDLKFTLSLGEGLRELGLSPNEVVGTSLYDFFSTRDPSFPPIAIHRKACQGSASTYEFEWRGRLFYCHVMPCLEPSQEISGALGVAFDITERKKNEEELKQRSKQVIRFQNVLLQLAKQDVFDLYAALRQITKVSAEAMGVNRVSVWRFSQKRDAIVCNALYQGSQGGHEVGMELRAQDYPAYFSALEESRTLAAHEAQSDPRTIEFSKNYLMPQGITSMLDVPIRIGGQVVGVLCHEHVGPARVWTPEEQEFSASIADWVSLAMESSERRSMQEALQQVTEELKRSNQELEQFAYVASHDLQEPLHKIVAFVDRLQSLPKEDLRRDEYFASIGRAAHHMRLLISDLLQFARVTTQAKPFEFVDLKWLVEEILSDLEVRIADYHAEFSVDSLPVVLGDRSQLRQLFQNLFSNALKFRKLDLAPRIHVFSEVPESGWVRVVVEDNGIGFDNRYRKKIFQPFQRLHSRSLYEGSGMGLTLCQKIVQRHQGRLFAEGEEGQGSKFFLDLPHVEKKNVENLQHESARIESLDQNHNDSGL